MDARLDAVETGLEAVSRLSSATAKGQGKERSQRLVLVLATGSFRERVVALVDKKPAEDADRPLTFTLLFKSNLEGLTQEPRSR